VVWPSPSRHGRPDLGLPVAANRRSVRAVTRPSLRFGITSASLRAKKSTHRRTCHIDKTCVCRPASSLNPETAGSAAENHTGIAGSQVLSRSGLPRPVSPDQLYRSPDRWLRYPLPAGSVSRTSRTTPSAMRHAFEPVLELVEPVHRPPLLLPRILQEYLIGASFLTVDDLPSPKANSGRIIRLMMNLPSLTVRSIGGSLALRDRSTHNTQSSP
jgi:hypothetical protein